MTKPDDYAIDYGNGTWVIHKTLPSIGLMNAKVKERYKTQDPKYVIIDNKLCNATTNEPIPDDEPIMIFRGKDNHALHTVYDYAERVNNDDHVTAVLQRAKAFELFRMENPDRMKEPDTNSFPEGVKK